MSTTEGAAAPLDHRALTCGLTLRALPETLDQDDRSVEVAIATGNPVRRRSFESGEDYDEVLVVAPGHVRLGRLAAGAPLLAAHDLYDLGGVIGVVIGESVRIEEGELRGRVRFSRRAEVEPIFRDVVDGILRNVSVGYRVHKWDIDNGTSPPTWRATDWEPFEVSLVPVPADPNTKVRALTQRVVPAIQGEQAMLNNEETKTDARVIDPPAEETTRRQAVETRAATPPLNTPTATTERERVTTILGVAERLRLPGSLARRWIDEGIEVEAVRRLAIDERAKLDAAEPINNLPRLPATPATPARPGEMVGRIIRALAAGRGDAARAAGYAEREWHDHLLARTLLAGQGSAGGFLIPEAYSQEIIELLRPRSVVRRLGATVLPMDRGTLTVPRLTGGANAAYVGESQNITKTAPTFGQLRLTARKLAALVPISNDLVRFSSPQADAVVRDDLVAALAQREDAAFLRDDGTGNAPKGLRHWAPVANLIPANATANLANVTTDLGKLVLQLKKNNVPMIRPGWILSPRSENYLMTVRDGNGNFAFRPEMMEGRLWTWPYGVTTQAPDNLGAGSDESEIYLVDFSDAVIAEASSLIVDVSGEAAYHDGTAVVSAFSLDQTVIRAIARHDFGMRHDASVAVLTAVKWL